MTYQQALKQVSERRALARLRRQAEADKQILLARATLALRYQRRGDISQDTADAVFTLLTNDAQNVIW